MADTWAIADDDRKNTAGEDRDNTDRAATAAVAASTARLATANTQPRVASPAAAPAALTTGTTGTVEGTMGAYKSRAGTRIAPAPPAVLPKPSGTSSNRSGTVGNLKNKPATDTNGQTLPVPPVTSPTKLPAGASNARYEVNGQPATKEQYDAAQKRMSTMQINLQKLNLGDLTSPG